MHISIVENLISSRPVTRAVFNICRAVSFIKPASKSSSKSSSGTSSSVTLISQQRKNLANAGLASLEMGLRPTAEQQAAMGYTDAQVDRAILLYWREQGSKQ